MPDGLDDHARALIHAALASVPRVQSAVLYGSRALGTFRHGSDIDLAIDGEDMTNEDMARLAGCLDELPLPYRYDLTIRSAITNPALAEHIAQHGVRFWERGIEDEQVVGHLDDYRFIVCRSMKDERERWALDLWLACQGRTASVVRGSDPPDFLVDGQGVEVTEVLQAGRKRGDEAKRILQHATGRSKVSPVSDGLDLSTVRDHGADWIVNAALAKTKKYRSRIGVDPTLWALLIYANIAWLEHLDWNRVRHQVSVAKVPFTAVHCLSGNGARCEIVK
ncbi:MAG: nucleotidyltransferase domain-containing protein [Planctomycetes bacterium]|nr:nucleotidyltransferase domain-containing protein [Planctomycetota bacterium]